jgi:hypothetical protein
VIDLRPTILAKSDQLNADDLIGGPVTVTITDVRLLEAADQPVAIHWEGGDGRPFKPCKSMRRVMAKVWGEDGKAFIGQRMTLYRDDRVRFGSDAVGGIRISHMSGIDRETTMALMVTRGKRAPYTVKPLALEPTQRTATRAPAADTAPDLTIGQRCDQFDKRVTDAPSTVKLKAILAAASKLREDAERSDPERWAESENAFNERFAEMEESERGGQ